jgi:hypothetical protein
MKRFFVLLLALVLAFGMSGCRGDDNAAATGDFKDPYEAYGLKKGEGGLSEAMYNKPPKAIAFQPFLLKAVKPEGIPLEMPEITMAKGDQETITIDEAIVYSQDNRRKSTGYVTARVDITFNPAEDGTIFQVNNEVASKMVHQRTGAPDNVQGETSFKGESIYQIAQVGVPGIPDEPYLVFVLGQKGKAGNSGLILCQITGVKL